MAKREVLIYVTKYGFEYVSSAKMYCISSEDCFIGSQEDNLRWQENSTQSIAIPS